MQNIPIFLYYFKMNDRENTGVTGNIHVPSSPLRGSAPQMFKFKVQAAFITFDFHWASASALIISLVTWEHFRNENCFKLLTQGFDALQELQ